MINLIEMKKFDRELKVGDKCEVFWTNNHYHYDGDARVVKLNIKTVVVELLEAISDYPEGHRIRVPRWADLKLWSLGNSVWPVDGEQLTKIKTGRK